MKKLSVILALVLLLGGCTYSVEVNDKSYVIAIGIDKGNNHLLKVSFLFAYPTGGGEETGGEKTKEKDLVTVEAPSVFSAMRLVETFKSKPMDVNHTKLIMFSKRLAEEDGIYSYVSDFVNTKGFRPSTYLCIATSEPEKLFKGMEPKQDVFIEKYIEHLFSKSANNDISEIYLYNQYFNMCGGVGGTILPLLGIPEKGSEDEAVKDYPYRKPDDFAINYVAGEVPVESDKIAVLCGYGVFKESKMIGTLGMMEGDIIKILEKNMPFGQFCVFYPNANKYVNVTLRQTAAPIIKVRTDGSPEIDINVRLWGEFTGDSGVFANREDYNEFGKYLDAAFTQKTNDLLYRSVNEFNADILKLGNRAKRNFLTNSQWDGYRWNEKYSSAKFNISVIVDINDFGELKYSPKMKRS